MTNKGFRDYYLRTILSKPSGIYSFDQKRELTHSEVIEEIKLRTPTGLEIIEKFKFGIQSLDKRRVK